MKSTVIFALAACAVLASGTAMSQETKVSSEKNRYALSEVDGGFVKIDRRLGTVSFCTITSGSMVCRMGADERKAYQETMDQMRAEIEALDARLAKLEDNETGVEEETSEIQPSEKADDEPELPEEFDTAMEIAQEAMRRFFSVIQELKKEYEQKTAEPKT